MRTEDWTALSIVTSGLTATLARWSQATQSADVAEAEVPTWERQMAAATVSRFCEAHRATRVEPCGGELDDLWQRCASLQPAALADALAAQLACEDGEVDWRRQLRALHAANHFFSRGGVGEAAAMPALEEAEELIRHLAEHVPQCKAQASRALSLVFGEAPLPEAPAPEREVIPERPSTPQPQQQALHPQESATVPRLPLPRLPSTSVARPVAIAVHIPDLVLPLAPAPAVADVDAAVVTEAPAVDEPSPATPPVDEKMTQAAEEELGFHWLDRSRIDSAVPKAVDPFSEFAAAAKAMAGVEGL